MQPVADNGQLLDATFSIESTGSAFDLIMESWGGPNSGGRLPRNPDYNAALELLLSRLGKVNAAIQSCVLDSRPAQVMAFSDRLLKLSEHPYPIVLSGTRDFHVLRLEIRGAQRAVGGNGGSRIRFRFTLPRSWPTSALEAFLVSPGKEIELTVDPWSEATTADPELLDARVGIVRAKMLGLRGGIFSPPPGSAEGKQTIGAVERFIRDPNIIAWVLEMANGICEICKRPAPFQRSNGDHFLEVHHIRTLADGGPDTVNNAVAACPNCHRELHHGANREFLRASVIADIARLVDHPKKTLTSN